MRKSVQVRIEGRVQGVWFRGWTSQEASSLGLSGWVRNCRDGSVHAVFSGEPAAVDLMLMRCRKGSPMARVDDIKYEPCQPPQAGFAQLPTA